MDISKECSRFDRTYNLPGAILSVPTRVTLGNGRSAMDQLGNLLARLSFRRRRTLGHYREVEHACSAGEFLFVALLIPHVADIVLMYRRKKKVRDEIKNAVSVANNHSRNATVGSPAAGNVGKVGALSNAPTERPRWSNRNHNRSYPLSPMG
jgi:hypothetical protein